MPMAGQDAVEDASTMQREAEMRAAIVDGRNAAIVSIHRNGAVLATHNHDRFLLDFRERFDTNHGMTQALHDGLRSFSTNAVEITVQGCQRGKPHRSHSILALLFRPSRLT
jgi:hypothetical protein